MAQAHKVLGQSAPTGTTNVDLYTVPSSTQSVISTISVANITTAAATYRIAVRPSGATIANQHWIAYDVSLGGGDAITLTLGITLSSTDVVTVRANTANALAFSAFGVEIT